MGIGMRLLVIHMHNVPTHIVVYLIVRGRMKGKEKERERNF